MITRKEIESLRKSKNIDKDTSRGCDIALTLFDLFAKPSKEELEYMAEEHCAKCGDSTVSNRCRCAREAEEQRLADSDSLFAQGARCGHLEGKGRAGMYVLQEEYDLAHQAARNQNLSTFGQTNQWEAGYRHGYCKAAEGSELEPELVNARLPRV